MIGRWLLLSTLIAAMMVPAASAHHEDQVGWAFCAAHPTCDPDMNPWIEATLDYASGAYGYARCMIKFPFTCDGSMVGETIQFVDDVL